MAAVMHLVSNVFSGVSDCVDVRAGDSVGLAVHMARPAWDRHPLHVTVNGRPADRSHVVCDGDVLRVAVVPEGGIDLAAMAIYAIVSAVVSYAISYFLFPVRKPGRAGSPAYSVTVDQNAARLGEFIPVIYGRVRATPDIAAQPYYQNDGNQQRLNMLLCLGQGVYDIHDVFIGGTRLRDFPAGTIKVWELPPSAHARTFGNIEAVTGAGQSIYGGVIEDCVTVLEAIGLELRAINEGGENLVIGIGESGTVTTGAAEPDVWNSLEVGQSYTATINTGQKSDVVFLGLDVDQRPLWEGVPPQHGTRDTVQTVISMAPAQTALESDAVVLQTGVEVGAPTFPDLEPGEVITFTDNASGVTYGPMQFVGDSTTVARGKLFTLSGPGLSAFLPINKLVNRAVTIQRNASGFYTFALPGNDPGDGGGGGGGGSGGSGGGDDGTQPDLDPAYKWRGWYAVNRPGTLVNELFFDLFWPQGITWITDKGDYRTLSVGISCHFEQIDDDSVPIPGTHADRVFTISGYGPDPIRRTLHITVPPGRYRVAITRYTTRDMRTSKEQSVTQLEGIRARIVHSPSEPLYADCTLIAMRFAASAATQAGQNRRITVDCTRRLPIMGAGEPVATTNPADAVIDAYTAAYGAAGPLAEIDTATLARFRDQWDTTGGFNAVFDRGTTVMEALQTILVPVRAIPVPTGKAITFVQDGPRPRQFLFGPGTVVDKSLTVTYSFDTENDYDHIALSFQDGTTWSDAQVFYPYEGVLPQQLDLFGCTNAAHALSWARLAWQERQHARKQTRITLEGEGYALQPLDRFGLVIPQLDAGNAGHVLAYDANTLTLELDGYFPPTSGATPPMLVLRQNDTGESYAPVYVHPNPNPSRFVTLYAPPYEPPIPAGTRSGGDGTVWTATQPGGVVYEFRVTDLQHAGDFRVSVAGQQYADAAYAGTFLEHWTT